MNKFTFLLPALFHLAASAQSPPTDPSEHIFIITTDGFRWQEVFTGADPAMIGNPKYVRDTALMEALYGGPTAAARRTRLMPFFWSVIAAKGQLFGNRLFHNKVNVSNFYKISYAGYSEILTGHPDLLTPPNMAINNKNRNVLEYLNGTAGYHGKVVAFSSWNVFPYILNEQRNGLPLNSGYDSLSEEQKELSNPLIERVQDSVSPKNKSRYDLLTYLNARQYIEKHHPSVVFIGLGETDEQAHAGRYDLYLQQAANVDRMIAELWYYVQTDPYYKDHTTFLITTDHGRGGDPSSWYAHGFWVRGSGEAWLAMLGPALLPLGEVRTAGRSYQKQLAATIALLLGEHFETDHRIGQPLQLALKDPSNGGSAPSPNLVSTDPAIRVADRPATPGPLPIDGIAAGETTGTR
ncbi:MAG: hypothetical protein P4L51_29765 [Puia sp.]|nr:hypothetical protein [Puia sp.]